VINAGRRSSSSCALKMSETMVHDVLSIVYLYYLLLPMVLSMNIYILCYSISILPMALSMDIYIYGVIVYIYIYITYDITYGDIYIHGVVVYLYYLWRYPWIYINMVL
jgi:hypothetical protein